MALELVSDVLFLDLSRVAEHDVGQSHRRLGGVNRSPKAILHEFWNQAAVVDVHMRQQHVVNVSGRDRTRVPISRLKPPLLKHAAIDHHVLTGHFQTIAATRDLPIRTEEMKLHDRLATPERFCCPSYTS